MTLSVHPSGPSPEDIAEERLRRRLERSNTLLRSICNGCGTVGSGMAATAPIDPFASLNQRPQTLVERRTITEDDIVLRPAVSARPSDEAEQARLPGQDERSSPSREPLR